MLLDPDALSQRLRMARLVAFDFDGVFTSNTVYVLEDGREAVRCWRGDGLGLRQLETLGMQLVILSTESNPVVAARARKLKIECVQGLADKGVAFENLLKARGLMAETAVFMGNDINDLACLHLAGVAVAVADAHPALADVVHYRTMSPGGQGAVRELCDLIVKAHGIATL